MRVPRIPDDDEGERDEPDGHDEEDDEEGRGLDAESSRPMQRGEERKPPIDDKRRAKMRRSAALEDEIEQVRSCCAVLCWPTLCCGVLAYPVM